MAKTQRADGTDGLVDPSVTEDRIRRALLLGGALIASALVVTFVFAQWRTERLLREQLVAQARAFTQEVVAIRRFVTMHGGVYVEASEEVEPNRYLEGIPGLKTTIVDVDGRRYVLRSPALVIREMNDELERLSGDLKARFRLASDAPLNPDNRADEFELRALEAFAEGATEYSGYGGDGDLVFRYVHPLEVDDDCVLCHREQGWEPGQVRGAISVKLDASAIDSAIVEGRLFTAVVLAGSIGTLLLALYLIVTRLLDGLLKAESDLRELAIRDSLTGLLNRRAALARLADEIARADRDGHEMAVLMGDLDNFKEVNDGAGHAAGDAVLVATAAAIRRTARAYDALARLGGEEFLLIMPSMGDEEAVAAAERVRRAVADATAAVETWGRPVTLSVGVAARAPGGDDLEDLLRRSDRALYAAKDAGRDRVVLM